MRQRKALKTCAIKTETPDKITQRKSAFLISSQILDKSCPLNARYKTPIPTKKRIKYFSTDLRLTVKAIILAGDCYHQEKQVSGYIFWLLLSVKNRKT